jgi:hypothetical protein
MERTILLVLVSERTEHAAEVQKILTENGCTIRTRLGLHDADKGRCANSGLIVLELVGDAKDHVTLNEQLAALSGVTTRLVTLALSE